MSLDFALKPRLSFLSLRNERRDGKIFLEMRRGANLSARRASAEEGF